MDEAQVAEDEAQAGRRKRRSSAWKANACRLILSISHEVGLRAANESLSARNQEAGADVGAIAKRASDDGTAPFIAPRGKATRET